MSESVRLAAAAAALGCGWVYQVVARAVCILSMSMATCRGMAENVACVHTSGVLFCVGPCELCVLWSLKALLGWISVRSWEPAMQAGRSGIRLFQLGPSPKYCPTCTWKRTPGCRVGQLAAVWHAE